MSVTPTSKYITKLTELQHKLPKSVQTLIWSTPTSITNEAFRGEILYPANCFHSENHRRVFTWIPHGAPDIKDPWVFETFDKGLTFSIKNKIANEYLYPDTLLRDLKRRNVFIWGKKILEPIFFWNVEIVGNDKVRLKSSVYKEYFYAENRTLAFDSERRSVFTGVAEFACDERCNWILD